MPNDVQVINSLRSNLLEAEYTQWRKGLVRHPNQYVIDIDQVEFRGETPVALIDLKTWPRYETPSYWEKVAKSSYTFAGKMYRKQAQGMGCKAYYVFPNFDIDTVMVYGLSDNFGWRRMTVEGYEKWLMTLPE